MPDEVIQKLMQLKHILTNVAASGYLGLPRKVLERLDKEGVFDKFGIEGSCKTPCHPWNRDDMCSCGRVPWRGIVRVTTD